MRFFKVTLICLALVFIFCNCFLEDDGFSKVVKEEKTLTFRGVEQLRLSNVTGDVDVMGWDRDHVEVRYRKKASSHSLLERLRVIYRQEGSVVDIDTDYPRKCRRCGISFKVFVPRIMEKIAMETVTGAVILGGLDHVDKVTAKTVTGSVKADLSGRNCAFSSVTGGIRARFKQIDEGGEITASLTTGSVKLYLPEDFTGQVRLQTVTGSVHTDFPITTSGVLKKNKIKGSIGQGSRRIRAETVTGSIGLLKWQG